MKKVGENPARRQFHSQYKAGTLKSVAQNLIGIN
jgi:hypothetical protein